MLNPYVIIIVGVLYAGSVLGSYLFGRSDGRDLEKAKAAEIQEVVDSVREAAIEGAAEEIAKIEVKHVTIRQQLQKEVIEKPVYRECRHTPDGLLWVNTALTNGEQPAPSGVMPGTDAPK